MKIKKYSIYKYCHRPFPFKILGIKKADSFIKEFKFLNSCRYILDNGDQFDWNKLCGITYGLLNIHEYSTRFVWRYSPENNKIEIAAYWYKNGERNFYFLCPLDLNEKYFFSMNITQDGYVKFCVKEEDGVTKLAEFDLYMGEEILSKNKYQNGIYFGGNRRAPHKIEIKEYYN